MLLTVGSSIFDYRMTDLNEDVVIAVLEFVK